MVPVLCRQVAIGGPVFDNVPEPIKTQKLKSKVGNSEIRVTKLVVERRIANPDHLRDIELLVQQTVFADRSQSPAEIRSQQLLVRDPIQIRPELKIDFVQRGARIARTDHA